MYPSFVDMNECESSKHLRMLELDAYSNILAALRAQGPPTCDKLKLLKELAAVLRIPQERCKAEIRKVISDEKLNTIAYFTCGQLETTNEWIKEGRRLVSPMSRTAPSTLYSTIADEVAEAASTHNEQLPLPANTDRKRSTSNSQVSLNTLDSIKSQQFKVPDAFKNEENKKRKLSFGIENSSLSQNLIGTSKISRIQQIYRQKVKSKTKEQQLQAKLKEQEQVQTQQPKTVQQQSLQPKVQKQSPSLQTTTTSSPTINILQNVSIRPPNNNSNNNKGEETIEQIKNEINSFTPQKSIEQNRTSPQPSGSNENLVPKQKQTIINIKSNPSVSYKHVASPGPSSEVQKSLKVCTTRKPITKTIPGQKLIIVSNAQSITSSSILQRTLTIPFVKNISVKNFDKFKIVSTSTGTSPLQITPIASTNALTTSSVKHKVVTVRTNPTTKKVIPLAHLHALNAKGSIKVLPVGGKILTKTTVPTSSSPIYIMNNMSGVQQALTKSTLSTSVIMTSRPQESVTNEVMQNNQETSSLEAPSDSETNAATSQDVNTNVDDSIPSNDVQDATKSSILADILKASGVISSDSEVFTDDIESQITQLTAIPQTVPERIMADETPVGENLEAAENCESAETQNNGSTFILLGKDQETSRLLKDLEGDDDSSDIVFGNLDPGTGEYTVETTMCHSDNEMEQTVLTDETYTMDVQKSTSISNNVNAVN